MSKVVRVRVFCQRWYYQNSATYEKAGVSLHLSERAHGAYLREFSKSQRRTYLKYRSVPGTYQLPEKKPFWCEVPAEALKSFKGNRKSARIHRLDPWMKDVIAKQESKELSEPKEQKRESLDQLLEAMDQILSRHLGKLEAELRRRKQKGR